MRINNNRAGFSSGPERNTDRRTSPRARRKFLARRVVTLRNSQKKKATLRKRSPSSPSSRDFLFLCRARQISPRRSRSPRRGEKRASPGLRSPRRRDEQRAEGKGPDPVSASSPGDRCGQPPRWIRLGPGGFPTNPAARTGERSLGQIA